MENLDPPPPPPKSRMGKWRVFALRPPSSLIWGGWGLLFHFILSKIAFLDKINGKPRPPSPSNQGWENGAFLLFARLHPWFGGGWGFAVPFYFVQDCRYQNPKKWPKKSIRKFSKKMFINPNFISKNLEIYSRNPDLSQLHIICIKCWIFVTCAIWAQVLW